MEKLRGTVEPSEYKHIVLSLIFLKFVCDGSEFRFQEIKKHGHSTGVQTENFDSLNRVFCVPENSRWSMLVKQADQQDISFRLDNALHELENSNPPLKGCLPVDYFTHLGINANRLSALIESVDKITGREEDVFGRIYEYFIDKFAAVSGKGGGEFYTPKCVVNLLVEMIQPLNGKVYDPCCGSGGMFVQSAKFIASHSGNQKAVCSIYGQELNSATHKLARMNLAIHGIAAGLGDASADTLLDDQHPDLRADYILANPPFNQKGWRASDELNDDPRWSKFGIPPGKNANFGWILHIISKLSNDGTAAFAMANVSLSSERFGVEKIRQKIVEKDLVDCMVALPSQLFYTTRIPICLWLLTKNKKARSLKGHIRENKDRSGQTLFIDASLMGCMVDRTHRQLSVDDISRISHTYHNWQRGVGYDDIPGFCKNVQRNDIAAQRYILIPSRYVGESEDEEESEPFEGKMQRLADELRDQMEKSAELDSEIKSNLASLGIEW